MWKKYFMVVAGLTVLIIVLRILLRPDLWLMVLADIDREHTTDARLLSSRLCLIAGRSDGRHFLLLGHNNLSAAVYAIPILIVWRLLPSFMKREIKVPTTSSRRRTKLRA
jgi:hypothetical protein